MRAPQPETLNELNEYVRFGRPGSAAVTPHVTIDLPGHIELGQAVVLRWQVSNAERASLRLFGPDGIAVAEELPLVGQRRLALAALGRHEVTIFAMPPAPRVGRRRRATQVRAVIDVLMPRPRIHLRAAEKVTVGEPVELSWRVTDAEVVRISFDGEARLVQAESRTTVCPRAIGNYAITVEAQGAGGRRECIHMVRVVAPPVIISIQVPGEAAPGDTVLIRYSITGARFAWLRALDRKGDQDQAIPTTGRIETEAMNEAERLQIVAEGFDGKCIVKTVTVQPKLFEIPSIDEELALLTEGVR